MLLTFHYNNKIFTLQHATKVQLCSTCVHVPSLNPWARWGRVVNATPRPIYSRQKEPSTNFTEVCVGPRAGLNGYEKEKEKTLASSVGSNPNFSLRSYLQFSLQ